MPKTRDSWKEIRIRSWNEFDKQVNKLPHRKWVYRGHSDASWELKTSLYRLFEDTESIIHLHKGRIRKFAKDAHERLLIERFKSNAHLWLKSLREEQENIEWLAIMQHHGAPTRLLDVTLSSHIASYFALETGHGDCAVFAFNHSALKEIDDDALDVDNYKDQIFENLKGDKSFILAYVPRMGNERLLAQQGLFLIPSNNYETFEQLLSYYPAGEAASIKFVIPAKLRYEGLERLRDMNITTSSLFPGLDGFCRSLRYQVLETTQSLRAIF